MEFEFDVALELRRQLALEAAVGVKARHLVLVLVGHQLEQSSGHRAGEWRCGGAGQLRLARLHAAHTLGVALRVGGVLVGAQVLDPARDQRLDRFVGGCFGNNGRAVAQRAQPLRVAGGEPTEREREQVVLHRDAVQLDGARQRGQAHRHQATLPGVAERQDVGDDGVAEKLLGQRLRVEGLDVIAPGGEVQLLEQRRGAQIGVGVHHRLGHRNLVHVGQHAGAVAAYALQRLGRRADHQVAGEHRVGLLGVYAHLVQPLGQIGPAHETQHRAALLREAHEVEHARALALEVRGHRDHRTHGHHAGAADAGDQQVVRAGPHVRRGQRQRGHVAFECIVRGALGAQRAGALAQPAADDADEARAEALDARVVLVARALVDLALAAECGLLRQHGDAVALHRAVATAFADVLVDEDAPRRIRQLALLAPAALLGGAGLLVDQHRHTLDLAQPALHRVERLARVELGARRKAPVVAAVLGDVVTDHHHLLDALALDLARDAVDADRAVDRLAAGHRHRVVEQDLVGDGRLRRHRLADRQVARVPVGAVAEVLEHVRHLGEHRVADPVDALAAHLDHALGVAAHPGRHHVAADAGLRARALGHAGAGVVRAAGAEVRHALDGIARVGQQLGQREVAHVLQVVAQRAVVREVARDPVRDDLDQPRRPQLAERRHQRLPCGVALADDHRPLGRRRVVEQVAQLGLDHRRLLLDDEDLLQAARELAQPRRLDRERQPHLVQPHAGGGEHRRRDLQPAQYLHQVEVRLAAGDDAHAGLRRHDHLAVDRVDARERAHRGQLVVQAHLDARARQVGPAVVQAVGRCRVAGERAHGIGVAPALDAREHRVEVDGGAAFDHLRQRGEPDPVARVARQRPAVEAEFEVLGHVGRRHDRHVEGLEQLVALVRHRRRHAAVVVAGHHQHAAVRRAAVGVAVLDGIARAVDARALAVPHREHAIDRALRVALDALRAQHLGGPQLLVDRRHKADAGLGELRARLPDRLVDHAQRRAAVAADEALRVQPGARVARALHQHQAQQRLRAGEEHGATWGPQVVAELVVRPRQRRDAVGDHGGHGCAPRVPARRSAELTRATRQGFSRFASQRRVWRKSFLLRGLLENE
ncbi:MAG: hypothetical protein LKCHEGNO_02736 [Burkholderiaceae bacterium]|nr:hypothetical protein [Burkholderiaceae bacterium]